MKHYSNDMVGKLPYMNEIERDKERKSCREREQHIPQAYLLLEVIKLDDKC